MEGQELRDGKARVRLHLIDPLSVKGMVRRRGQPAAEFDEMMARLESRLAYMTVENLEALAEVVERHAGGKYKDTWPKEIMICNWAWRLQQPPASVSRLVRTYLQSAAGEAAKAGGYLVELFSYLKKFGAPPNAFALDGIIAEADHNRSRKARIQRDQEDERASARDLIWLKSYMDARRRVLEIIKSKPSQEEQSEATA